VLKLCFEIEGKVGKVGKVEEIKKIWQEWVPGGDV